MVGDWMLVQIGNEVSQFELKYKRSFPQSLSILANLAECDNESVDICRLCRIRQMLGDAQVIVHSANFVAE